MATRDIHVRIIGDASSVKKAMKESGDAASKFNSQVGGVRQSMDDLVRVSSARGKGIGGFRLAGIGLTAGFAIAGTTRAIADLRDGLEVTGEESETFTGRIRNMGAAILGGDFVGAFQAMTRETHSFTAAQAESIAVMPQFIEQIKRMGDEAALSTAALAGMAAMTVTPGTLQLGAARAGRTSTSRDNLANLDAQIADREQTIVRIKKMSGLVIEEGEADKILAVVIGQVTALEDQKASLLDRLGAAKQKTAAAARAALEASFLTGLKGLGLKADKALLTATLNDDIAASNEIIRLIQIQIGKEGRTFELESQLTQARLKRQGIIQTQQANAAAAAAANAAAAASAQAERDRQAAEAERRARDAEERARKALEARHLRIQTRQFDVLGLGPGGAERIPGVAALRAQRESLLRRVEGTVLDTPKTAAQLERIRRVLSGKFGKVGKDVRSAILQMFKDIRSGFEDGNKNVAVNVTSTQRRGVGKILEGLGLTPEQVRALRQRLAKGGTIGGFGQPTTAGAGVPHGAGRGDVIVNGNLVVQGQGDVNSFVKEVQRKGRRSSASRRGVSPGVNRGMA